MPTGYTAGVQDGTITDFRTFALRCARAFGATILQRDDPMDVPPVERQVDDYYREAVTKAEDRVAELRAMTPAQAATEADAAYRRRMEQHRESVERTTAELARYRAMLADVKAWKPPTTEHQGLKKFMVEQLEESIRFDDHTLSAPEKQTAAAWLTGEREQAAKSLAYAAKALREEEERCAQASEWVRQLYQSLDGRTVNV